MQNISFDQSKLVHLNNGTPSQDVSLIEDYKNYPYPNKNEGDVSVNEINRSRNSSALDNSFMRVNSKIEEYKQSIRDKIRMMKTSLAYDNSITNKKTNRTEMADPSRNLEISGSNLQRKITPESNTTSYNQKSFLISTMTTPAVSENLILHSFRNRLKKQEIDEQLNAYQTVVQQANVEVYFKSIRRRVMLGIMGKLLRKKIGSEGG